MEPVRYYLDTCIWIDYFENRSDRFRPLGEWALATINLIIRSNAIIIFTNIVERELLKYYSPREMSQILSILPPQKLVIIRATSIHFKKARCISKEFGLPITDCIHIAMAESNNAIFVTRDKHFDILRNMFSILKPEELI